MKGLSREEKIQKRITELERQIYEKDEILDKEQWKRVKRTFFVICGVIYFLIFYFALEGDINASDITATSNADIPNIIETIFYVVVALTFGVGFFAGLIMFISFWVVFYIMNGAMKRAETIAKLKAELDTIKYYDIRFKDEVEENEQN